MKFRAYLRSRRLTEGHISKLLSAFESSIGDPAGALQAAETHRKFKHIQWAWDHWANWTGYDEVSRLAARMKGPRPLPSKPRVIPTEDEVRLAAEAAAGARVPHGPLLWMVYLSGLRVGEVCQIQRSEAQEALRRPEVTIHQKGAGGMARRTWVPGMLVRPALAALLRLPWRVTYMQVASSPDNAAEALRKRMPGRYGTHDHRHAVARMMRRLIRPYGLGIEVVSAVLGHDLTKIMGSTGIYAPPSAEEIDAAHAILAAGLWPQGFNPPADSWLRWGGLPQDPGAPAAGAFAPPVGPTETYSLLPPEKRPPPPPRRRSRPDPGRKGSGGRGP